MTSQRDLFANFERMRREMDELFGDVLERRRGLRGRGFSPRVDVYYTDDPPRAVVKVDLDRVAVHGWHVDGHCSEIGTRRTESSGSARGISTWSTPST